MSARWRKAIGGILTLAFLAGYVWAALALGEHVPRVWWAQLAYYLVAGVAWGVPLIPLIAWMNRGR
jgi:hypothetical protein